MSLFEAWRAFLERDPEARCTIENMKKRTAMTEEDAFLCLIEAWTQGSMALRDREQVNAYEIPTVN